MKAFIEILYFAQHLAFGIAMVVNFNSKKLLDNFRVFLENFRVSDIKVFYSA